MSELENGVIAIQNSGRLTQETIKWVNEAAGADFGCSEEPFDRARELFDSATGITLVGYKNGDSLKTVACGLADMAVAGSDKYWELAGPMFRDKPAGLIVKRYLGFGLCRMAFARPTNKLDEPVRRVATSYPRSAAEYFLRLNKFKPFAEPQIDVYGGGVEMIARRSGYDGIVEVVHSGDSLAANGLQEVDEIGKCEAGLIVRSQPAITPRQYDMLSAVSPLELLQQVLLARKVAPSESFAARLVLEATGNLSRKKLAEETGELIAALAINNVTNGDQRAEVISEAADVLFSLQACLVQAGVSIREVENELTRRCES